MLVFRIVSGRYPANDGQGAARYGGRWNRKDIPLVYTGASRALRALEILAGSRALASDYVAVRIEIPEYCQGLF